MIARLRLATDNPQLRAALDWTVFGIGAVSLTVAIAATVLSHQARQNGGVETARAETAL